MEQKRKRRPTQAALARRFLKKKTENHPPDYFRA
jgi:hypothetical protein